MDEARALERIASCLQVESVSADDNFYDLGGDSLAALELADVLTAELEREVEVTEVVTAPTFGALLSDGAGRA